MSERGPVLKAFAAGITCTLLVLGGGAWGAAKLGMIPANADTQPSALERRFAHTALDAWLESNTPKQENPIALTDENLIGG